MSNPNNSQLIINVKNEPLIVAISTNSSIIYLIGKNGAGKTRFIEGLKNGKASIMRIVNKGGHGVHRQRLIYRFYDWGGCEYDITNSVNQKFEDINKTLNKCDQDSIDLKENIKQGSVEAVDGTLRQTNEITFEPKLNNIQFNGISDFSEGTKKYYQMSNWNLNDNQDNEFFPIQHKSKNVELNIIAIEEPENNFHPKLQRELPEYFENWILEQENIKAPILLIVSTHSPFVIKGASNFPDQQRIYGLDKCELIDLTGKKDQQKALEGVSGAQSIIVANSLLGSGIGDFFPNPILIAENSVLELLNGLSQSTGFPINDFLVSSGGDGDIENKITNLQEMSKMLKIMHRSFPERNLFKFKIIIVVDDVKKKEEWVKKFENNHDFEIEVYGLGEQQLEDIYPDNLIKMFIKQKYPKLEPWNKEGLINKYIEEVLGLKGREKGVFKKTLAKFVSERIKTKDDIESYLLPVSTLLKDINII